MANNEEILTEEVTFEEMSNTYQLDATEYDENDEGTIEYLDLELELDSIPESTKEHIPEVPEPRIKSRIVQSSVLKSSYLQREKSKRKQKQIRAKRALNAPTQSIFRTESSTNNILNPNSTSQAGEENIDNPASEMVHAAVSAINAKLADSARSMKDQERKTSSQRAESLSSNDFETSQITKTDIKSEVDSLDLFFQSMAQTVLHLPSRVQAKIKMDIYKVIAMAEIKYGSSDALQDANKF